MALPSNLKVGNTYRFENKADTRGRSMNVYSPNAGTAPSLSNVCLWTPSNTDTEQQWVLKEYSGKYYLTPKSNGGVALDIYTGSASGQKNINAHLYARSSTSYIQIASAGSGYITMKSTSNGKYLTANQNNNGTSSGRTANSTGNVYWYGKLTDGSQEWLPVLIGGSDPDPEPPVPGGNLMIYPCKTMKITQTPEGDNNHYLYSSGTPVDYPIDEGCDDTGRSWIYCPCDQMKVVKIYGVETIGANTVWLESTQPVDMPCGSSILTMMVTHPNDDDLKSLKEGRIFERGVPMFREGGDGSSGSGTFGNHFHISFGKGQHIGNGWTQNSNYAWVLQTTKGTIRPEEAVYLDNSFTTNIINSHGIPFIKIN